MFKFTYKKIKQTTEIEEEIKRITVWLPYFTNDHL